MNVEILQTDVGLPPEEIESAPLKPLTIWKPSQFLAWTEPEGNHLLLPAYLTRGQLLTIIGQGGLGKSRLTLWLAICQILGRDWCGLKTGGDPQTWLTMGDENGLARQKTDLSAMLCGLTESERQKVDSFLRLQALVDMEDGDVWMGDGTTQARIAMTIEQHRPGVVVIDPLANFAPGDIAKPGDMKEAIRLVLQLVRRAAPQAATIIIHHARTGRQNIAQGIGWDAGNFASGGKAIFASSRCQLNLMPAKSDDDTRLVLSCGKANNCEKFSTRGLIFDPRTFTYAVDPDFDADTWRADVEGKSNGSTSLCTVADVVAAVRDGYRTTKALKAHLIDTFDTSKRTAERLIERASKFNGIHQLTRGNYILGAKSQKILDSIT